MAYTILETGDAGHNSTCASGDITCDADNQRYLWENTNSTIPQYTHNCFVTAGVALNMSSFGSAAGYAAVILPQLKAPNSAIPLDDSSASWIAAILGVTQAGGTLMTPPIMAIYGRKITNLISIIVMMVSWICIASANSIPIILLARTIQGVGLGMVLSVGPVLIGEYTSPRNRGAFLAISPFIISLGVLMVHTLGVYFSWQITALVCAIIAFIDLVIVIYSPESPSWFIDKERYEEAMEIFRWLRGNDEEDELQKMIKANIVLKKSRDVAKVPESRLGKIKSSSILFTQTVQKKEFYKPIFVMLHVYGILHWSGVNFTSCYIQDIVYNVIGPDANVGPMVISIAAQRAVSNACSVYLVKKIRRRVVILTTAGLVVVVYMTTAGYTYAKNMNVLPFDHPAIGVALIHSHMFLIATGALPLPYIIAGELFPLEYRSLSGGICSLFFALYYILAVKTFPFLYKSIGIHGAYTLYAGIVGYFLVILWIYLPETKDRTLQDIEDEFRGKPVTAEDLKSIETLQDNKTR